RRGIDPFDAGMGVRRAQEHRVHQAIEPQVVQVAAGAGGETGILPPPRRIAYDGPIAHSGTFPMTTKRQLHLGAFMRPISIHTAAWRYPGAYPDANFNL